MLNHRCERGLDWCWVHPKWSIVGGFGEWWICTPSSLQFSLDERIENAIADPFPTIQEAFVKAYKMAEVYGNDPL